MTYSKKALRRNAYAAVAIDDVDTRLAAVESAAGISGGNLQITNADVAANAAIALNKIAGTAVATNDARLSDARTPTAHAASHATGQSDALTAGNIGAIDLATFKTLVSNAVDYAAFQTAVAALT